MANDDFEKKYGYTRDEIAEINLDDYDENGHNIKEEQKQKAVEESIKNSEASKLDREIANLLNVVKINLQAKVFDEAEEFLKQAEQKEKDRADSKGYCDNPEVYWCRVLLKFKARDEADLISKHPDISEDSDFLRALAYCKTDEQKQRYLSVAVKIKQAEVVAQPRPAEVKPVEVKPVKAKHVQNAATASDDGDALKRKLRRIFRLIDAGEFDEAKEHLNKIENDEIKRTDDCEIPQVYHYKMLIDYKARTDEELIAILIEKQEDITQNKNYRLAKGYAEDIEDDDEFDVLLNIKKKSADGIAKAKAETERKAEEERKRKIESLTQQADEAYKNKKYSNAVNLYNQAIQLGADDLQEKVEQTTKEEQELKRLSGGFYDLGNGYVTFGTYPQTKKEESVQIGEIVDGKRGYFLGSDNCLYGKHNNEYYKVEPIKWKLLSRENECFIVSDMILDPHIFDSSKNNYSNSEIRNWLNGEFYEKAFRGEQKSKIIQTVVDNSLASTCESSNQYVCGNTSEKVFLLSHKEAKHYFSIEESRQRKGTDYAKARNLSVTDNGYSHWWLRSPYSVRVNDAWAIANTGVSCDPYVYDEGVGVLPALKLKP